MSESNNFNIFEFLVSSEAKETRRRLLWEFFNQLARANPDFFGTERRIFVYDCADTLFCVRDLGLRVDEFRDFELQVDRGSKIPQT